MRILHTSDWHLGRTLHGVDLSAAHAAFLDHLVEVVRAERVDAVLVAGDVYDRAVPPVDAVELLSDTLGRLTEIAPVVLTPGNHDSAARLGFGAGLYRERLAVRSTVAALATPVALPDGDGGLGAYVYALPYLDPDLTREQLAEDGPDGERRVPARSHEAVTAAALRRVRQDLTARRQGTTRVPAVLMGHMFVVGGQASESERDIRVGGVDGVPAGVFADEPLDYVALGHLHGPQQLHAASGPQLRYAGSPLAFSFSERHHRKSVAVVDLGPDGVRGVELLDCPVPRPIGEVVGSLDELLGRRFDPQADHWLRVVVTDDVRPPELYARVRGRFPHALVIQHRPSVTPQGLPGPSRTAQRDPLDVAAEFVTAVTGTRPTGAEAAVLRAAYEDVLAAERSA